MRLIVLDTETTGLDLALGNRIIEIGCVEIVDRKLTGRHYHQYINPERDSEEGALAVHGLTTEFLADKPVFAQVMEAFLAFLGDAELVIHNAAFDGGFLSHEISQVRGSPFRLAEHFRITDTLLMARERHPGQKNNLDALCKRYGVDNSQRELHGALLDAELLADVYLAMTGGQTTLALGAQGEGGGPGYANHDVPRRAVDPALVARLAVPVASVAECAAHADKLAEIRKKAGRCLWDQYEPEPAAS